jgi:hypothetical protein
MSRYTKANLRIFMQFVVRPARRLARHVSGAGLQTPLPKTLIFKDEGKIRDWHTARQCSVQPMPLAAVL